MPRNSKSPPKRKSTFEKWVVEIIARLIPELNLNEWEVNAHFDEKDDVEGCTAFANIDVRYLRAHICFTPLAREMWNDGHADRLTRTITHELNHILLQPMYDFALQAATPQTKEHLTDILEQTNQRLTRIVMDLLPPKFFQY
jgi:hypothetical protein